MPLPPGLLLNPATGEVTGTPTEVGTYNFQLKARDTIGTQRVIDESITINAYTPMSLTGKYKRMMNLRTYSSVPLASGLQGPTFTGGLGPFTWTLQAGALPTNVSLNSSNGQLSALGGDGGPAPVGAVNFTIRVTDSIGQTRDIQVTDPILQLITVSYTFTVATVGVPYSKMPTTAGGTAPYTYERLNGAFPPGLTINPTTGQVSGTPTVAATYGGISIRATDSTVTQGGGFAAQQDSISITVVNPVALNGALGRGTVGGAYNQAYTASLGQTPYTWSLDSGSLPTGTSLNTSTGAITGTLTNAGTFNPVIRVTDAVGNTITRTNPITIAEAVSVSGTPPGGTINVPYSFTPVTAGGWTPYVFDISAGSLPNGLTLNTSTGAITGTPTLADSFSATLRATDADGNTDTIPVNITIENTMDLTGGTPNRGTTTVAYSGTTFNVTGGQTPYVWSIFSGALPPGLSINTATGAITGTPTTPGTYNFVVRVSDAQSSHENSAQQTITVAAFPSLSGTLTDGSNGVAYNDGFVRSGGHAPFAWDISAGALPNGLTINATSGHISGTPSANGTFNFTVRVTDDEGNVATRPATVTIYAVPALSGAYVNEAEAKTSGGSGGTAYNDGITITGGKAPIAYSLVGGTIPPGLTLNNSTGVITGTPNAIGSTTAFNFTVRATDALGQFDTLAGTITVYPHITAPATVYASGTVTVPYSEFEGFTGGKTPFSHAITSGSLPNGLSLNPSTGAITGTPTVAGTFNFTITATDALSQTAAKAFSVVINPEVAIGNPAPDSFTSTPYTHTYTKSGGNGSYVFSVVSGAVPAGFSLSSAGVLSGTPTTPGTYNFTVRVSSAGDTADLPESVVITQLLTVAISNQSITGAREIEPNPFPPPGTIRGNGQARYELQANGQARKGESDTNGNLNFTNITNEWLQAGAASGAQVEMVFDNTSGISGSPNGSGVWTTLGSGTVGWTLTSGTASTTRTGTCRLRRSSDNTVLDTATITLTIGF